MSNVVKTVEQNMKVLFNSQDCIVDDVDALSCEEIMIMEVEEVYKTLFYHIF